MRTKNWIQSYKLDEGQKLAVRKFATDSAKVFKLFNWDWNGEIPTEENIEKLTYHLISSLLESNGTAPLCMCGRLAVQLDEVFEDEKRVNFSYLFHITDDFEGEQLYGV